LKVPAAALGEVEQPARQIAGVHELDLALGRRRCEHLAAARHPVRPVGEPAGGIACSDEEARADVRVPARKDIGDDVFAEPLERAVIPPVIVVHELVDGPVSDLANGALLGVAAALLGVDGDAGDEHVMLDGVSEELGRGANDVRDVARRIDDCVPAPALEHGEIALAISAQPLGLGEELGVRLAPVEEGHLVATGERVLDRGAPEEFRPAQDEQLHAGTVSPACGFLLAAR